jgi:hypothetical protein
MLLVCMIASSMLASQVNCINCRMYFVSRAIICRNVDTLLCRYAAVQVKSEYNDIKCCPPQMPCTRLFTASIGFIDGRSTVRHLCIHPSAH